MDGHYPRRDEDKDTSVTDSFRESASHYADTVRSQQGPADEAGHATSRAARATWAASCATSSAAAAAVRDTGNHGTPEDGA